MDRIHPLLDAHPYIRLFRGRTFVVKLSGALLEERIRTEIARDIALLHDVGIRIVVVHGGGPQLDSYCQKMDIPRQVVAGRRVTDLRTQEAARMVFMGLLNTELVGALAAQGIKAVGMTGGDGAVVTGVKRPARVVRDPSTGEETKVDFGYVGDIHTVDRTLLDAVMEKGMVPVLAPLIGGPGGVLLNVNADTIAARVAMALQAEKLVLCTSVAGLLEDPADPRRLVSYGDLDTVEELIGRGVVSGGMLPKVAAIGEALRGDVQRVHIIDGTRPHSLLMEIFTNEGVGTMLVRKRDNG
ncbi:MAG TPA: acetylglutamate kinase [Myxococcota bacterium]|nr:acetylglutamate kinase [Myxococcota bacterium]